VKTLKTRNYRKTKIQNKPHETGHH